MNTTGIYEVINMLNGKSYIGQSIHIDGRPGTHIKDLLKGSHFNRHLQNAFNKYGYDNFTHAIILYCEDFELDRYEDALIKADRSSHYNMREVASSNKGIKMSDETKRKISESLMGNTHTLGLQHSEKSKKIFSACHMGHVVSEDTKIKMGAWQKGKKLSDETKAKIGKANTGKKHGSMSDERKQKLSDAMIGKTGNIGKKCSAETKQKLSVALKGRIFSADTRHKMSEADKGKVPWNKGKECSAETKQKISASNIGKAGSMKGKKHTEAARQKMRDVWARRKYNEKIV